MSVQPQISTMNFGWDYILNMTEAARKTGSVTRAQSPLIQLDRAPQLNNVPLMLFILQKSVFEDACRRQRHFDSMSLLQACHILKKEILGVRFSGAKQDLASCTTKDTELSHFVYVHGCHIALGNTF